MARTGTCPECKREGLKVSAVNDLLPRHKPAPGTPPQAIFPDGSCKGSGLWAFDNRGAFRGGIAGGL